MVEISHDAFGRFSLVRRLYGLPGITCSFCGRQRKRKYVKALFQYGTERDDRPGEHNVSWHSGEFCSKGCHDSYHG